MIRRPPRSTPGRTLFPYTTLFRSATSDVDVVVHLVSTPANLAPLARHQTDKIKLVELHLPSLPDLPPALHTTKRLPARLIPSDRQSVV